jgi:hypothetical protein
MVPDLLLLPLLPLPPPPLLLLLLAAGAETTHLWGFVAVQLKHHAAHCKHTGRFMYQMLDGDAGCMCHPAAVQCASARWRCIQLLLLLLRHQVAQPSANKQPAMVSECLPDCSLTIIRPDGNVEVHLGVVRVLHLVLYPVLVVATLCGMYMSTTAS